MKDSLDPTLHCALCDHQVVTFKEGTLCGLDNRKPAFHRMCPKIALNEKFEDRVLQVNYGMEEVQSKKWWAIFYFALFVAGSLVAFWLAYYFVEYFFGSSGPVNGRVPKAILIPVGCIAGGVYLLTVAISELNKYFTELSLAKERKRQVDMVLERYRITYDLRELEDKLHSRELAIIVENMLSDDIEFGESQE